MIKLYDKKKGNVCFHGPYKIKETRTNGTVVVIRNEEGNVLETYNIRKLKPYTGPAIPVRARVVHQAEGQAHYFFVEEANRMEAYIFERSIAGGRECSKLEGLHHWPPNHNWIFK